MHTPDMAITFKTLRDILAADEDSHLDGQPLQIIDETSLTSADSQSTKDLLKEVPSAISIATVLYNWCPVALRALLDLDSWFSLTWRLTIQEGEEDEANFEINRIRSSITFGRSTPEGMWIAVFQYDIEGNEEGHVDFSGGTWKPNMENSMIGMKTLSEPDEVDRLASSLAASFVSKAIWKGGRKIKHEFFVEPSDVPFDAWGDGLAVDPRWLYSGLDLSKCTTCGTSTTLRRCGRCGTAAYCSSKCQQQDWQIHKGVCTLSMEDRGKALHFCSNGGLIGFDWEINGHVDDKALNQRQTD